MDQLALLFVLLLGAVVTVPLGDRLGLPAPVLMTLLGIVLARARLRAERGHPAGVHPAAAAAAAAVRGRAAHLLAAVRRQHAADLPARRGAGVRHDGGRGRRRQRDRARAADRRRRGARRAGRAARPGRGDRRRRTLGLPRRLVSILEGEGLFNDVTAIVLYHVAIAAAVSGTFSGRGAPG